MDESREGFCWTGRGRSFHVDGPKTEKVREPAVEFVLHFIIRQVFTARLCVLGCTWMDTLICPPLNLISFIINEINRRLNNLCNETKIKNKIKIKYFIFPCRTLWSPYMGKAQQPQVQRYPFLSVCVVFRVSRRWYGCQCLGFLTCTQMLMQAIAHGGCTDTVRESALKVAPGRKIP